MGGAVSAGEDNDELIDNLVEAEYIKSPHVERIFRAVDRGDYYLEGCKENAYRDLAWKHGNIHLSAPCIYSEVMESLKLGPGMSFLNLGSGTGYLSTMAGLVLGTYGVNHGVELHDEVVEYARAKLEEFQSSSPALDKYEFCPPSFVVGNCLLLDSTSHQYDRVYCGASCPSEHENYMKNLVRVGGILVMPLNDHLLQVTRTGETTFEVKNVLPVSFASLVPPHPTEAHTFIKLPENNPLRLQEICRSTIRILLRANAEAENPSLKDKKKLVPTKRRKSKRRIRKVVIPVFDESHASEERSSDERPTLEETRSVTTGNLLVDELQRLERLEEEDRRSRRLRELDEGETSDVSNKRIANNNNTSEMQDELQSEDGRKHEYKKKISSADGSRRTSSLDSNRRASSLDGSRRISNDIHNRSGSQSDSESNMNMSREELLDRMLLQSRALFRRRALLLDLEYKRALQIQRGNNNQAEAMDTTDTTKSDTQNLNSEVVEQQENSTVEETRSSFSIQNAGNGDSGIDNISDDSVPEESSSDAEKTVGDEMGSSYPSTSRTVASGDASDSAHLSRKFSAYLKRSAEENEEDQPKSGDTHVAKCCRNAVVFKRIAYSDVDSDDFEDDFESDSGKESCPKDYAGTREKSDLSCYTYHMRQKINMLPLPLFLKKYLNFYRPV